MSKISTRKVVRLIELEKKRKRMRSARDCMREIKRDCQFLRVSTVVT